jgi:hypothetical protein
VWPWIGGCVVLLLIIIGSFSGGNKDTGSSSASSAESTTARALTTTGSAPPPMPGIGQEARDGKFAFTVTGVATSKTAGNPCNQFEQTTAQGVYVIVSMTGQNIGNRSRPFFATNQTLKDTTGRQFPADSSADMWINQGIQTDINLGNQVNAKAAFDVPTGMQPSAIELHDSMFSGGASVRLS